MGRKKKNPPKIEDLPGAIAQHLASGRYRSTYHSRLRQNERSISLQEIKYVLLNGRREPARDEFREEYQAWCYVIRGATRDGDKNLRIIISFSGENMLIVTAVQLER